MKPLLLIVLMVSGWGLAACARVQQALAKVKAELALAYMAQGQGQEALRQIEAAVQLAPEQPQMWRLYGQQGLAETAEASYLKALALAPNDGAANHHYGWYLCQMQNRQAEGLVYLDRAAAAAYATNGVLHSHQTACVASQD